MESKLQFTRKNLQVYIYLFLIDSVRYIVQATREYVDQGGVETGGCNAMTHYKIATMEGKINCSKKMI